MCGARCTIAPPDKSQADGRDRGAGAFQVRVAETSQQLRTSLLRTFPAAPLTPHLQRFITALAQLHLPLLRRGKPPTRKAARSRRAVPRPRLPPQMPPLDTASSSRADTLSPAPPPTARPVEALGHRPEHLEDSYDAAKTGDDRSRWDLRQPSGSAVTRDVAAVQVEGEEVAGHQHGGEAAAAARPSEGRGLAGAAASAPAASADETLPGTADDAVPAASGAPAAVTPFTGRLQPHLRSAGALLQRLPFLRGWGATRRTVRPPHLRPCMNATYVCPCMNATCVCPCIESLLVYVP